MGSCLSSGYSGKKKVASAASTASVSVPAIPRKQELRGEDSLQDLATRGDGLAADKRSLPIEVRQQQQQQPVEELDPAIWSQLPDDITRMVLDKLPWSSLRHLQCVCKQWRSWINESSAANEDNRQVHPLVIFMYTLILVKDLDDPETRADCFERSSLARYFHG